MTTRNFCKRFNPRPAQFRALFRTAVPLIAVLLAVTGCPDPTDSPVDAAVPTITGQPAGAAYNPGDTPEALTVTASVTDGGTLSYQWYRNDTNDTETPESVGENTAAYTPSITSAGTAWYYVVVTNTNNAATGAKTASATSAIVSITVGVSGGGAYELTLTNIPRIVTGDAAVGLVPAPGTGTVTVAGTGTIADHTITVTLKNLDESFNPTTDWVKDDAGYQVVLMYGDGYGLTIYDRDAEAAPLPPNAAVSAAGFDGLVWKAPVMEAVDGRETGYTITLTFGEQTVTLKDDYDGDLDETLEYSLGTPDLQDFDGVEVAVTPITIGGYTGTFLCNNLIQLEGTAIGKLNFVRAETGDIMREYQGLYYGAEGSGVAVVYVGAGGMSWHGQSRGALNGIPNGGLSTGLGTDIMYGNSPIGEWSYLYSGGVKQGVIYKMGSGTAWWKGIYLGSRASEIAPRLGTPAPDLTDLDPKANDLAATNSPFIHLPDGADWYTATTAGSDQGVTVTHYLLNPSTYTDWDAALTAFTDLFGDPDGDYGDCMNRAGTDISNDNSNYASGIILEDWASGVRLLKYDTVKETPAWYGLEWGKPPAPLP